MTEKNPSGYGQPNEKPFPSKITVPGLRSRKGKSPILCLTAYDYPTARLADEAGFDLLLVGDSMANVVLGHATTLKITLSQIISATRAVRRAVDRPLVVADMPFGSYHIGDEDTAANAIRLIREGGAQAVKLEGGINRAKIVKKLVDADIPVMGHIGILPQSINSEGGYRVQGKTLASAKTLLADALAIQQAGAFAIVLEGLTEKVAESITKRLDIPTIGIGAGKHVDGQILVFHDVVGFTTQPAPKFVRRYADVAGIIGKALGKLVADIQSGDFPSEKETYQEGESLPKHWAEDATEAQSAADIAD